MKSLWEESVTRSLFVRKGPCVRRVSITLSITVTLLLEQTLKKRLVSEKQNCFHYESRPVHCLNSGSVPGLDSKQTLDPNIGLSWNRRLVSYEFPCSKFESREIQKSFGTFLWQLSRVQAVLCRQDMTQYDITMM